jgi:hypothetical protein
MSVFPLCPPLNLNLSQLWWLWTWAPFLRARGSSELGIKTEVVLQPGVLACLTMVGVTPFCRSKFLSMCLICDCGSAMIFLTLTNCQILSCVCCNSQQFLCNRNQHILTPFSSVIIVHSIHGSLFFSLCLQSVHWLTFNFTFYYLGNFKPYITSLLTIITILGKRSQKTETSLYF